MHMRVCACAYVSLRLCLRWGWCRAGVALGLVLRWCCAGAGVGAGAGAGPGRGAGGAWGPSPLITVHSPTKLYFANPGHPRSLK